MADAASQRIASELAVVFTRAKRAIDTAQQELRRMDELNRRLADRLAAGNYKTKGEDNGRSDR